MKTSIVDAIESDPEVLEARAIMDRFLASCRERSEYSEFQAQIIEDNIKSKIAKARSKASA